MTTLPDPQTIFLQRQKAKLAISQLLGFLDRTIKRRLFESEHERLRADYDMWQDIKVKARAETRTGILIPAIMFRIWRKHPMKKYLDDVEIMLYRDEQKREPPGLLDHLSIEEFEDYLRWRRHVCKMSFFDGHTPEDIQRQYLKERKKSLPVMPPRPTRAGLPSQVKRDEERRLPDHRNGDSA